MDLVATVGFRVMASAHFAAERPRILHSSPAGVA
jgi:hypothetical protein